MTYNHTEIEKKWQDYWRRENIYTVEKDESKPKYYVLDMFPYPSGAGLHVGHPLGYIASDIISRYKRLKGYNVLHPMGFDSFGLPAEQHAINYNLHPAKTTEKNINTYKRQLKQLGLSFDWNREISTTDPKFYKWTQWIFSQLFLHYYDKKMDKARPISKLIAIFEKEGNGSISVACSDTIPTFTAEEWKNMSSRKQQHILLGYRLTYVSEEYVNWCQALGTVLANDEVKDGLSERGEHPVEKRKIKQWMMRITAFAERLNKNLDDLLWSDAMKEMQRNWIGKSHGIDITFKVLDKSIDLKTFTTRPDTIFGVTYLVMSPEHDLVSKLTTPEQKEPVQAYVEKVKKYSERERMIEAKGISGVFTGSYIINPFNQDIIQLWVADYVLKSYGTGVVMAVPCSDDRDHRFAKYFNLPIKYVIEGTEHLKNPCDKKKGKIINSDFLNGLHSDKAIEMIIERAQKKGIGKTKVNYKLRDAVFARQRYWGEPIPIYYDENDLPQLIAFEDLPLKLPHLEDFKPLGYLAAPLSKVKNWRYKDKYPIETNTMPVWAGSSWYFLRYMDPLNNQKFVDNDKVSYWNKVDLYVGGTEHATGHLLYSRFWNLFLYDIGQIPFEEPFNQLFNQGMIQGNSAFIHKVKSENKFVSFTLKDEYETKSMRVDINLVKNDKLDIEAFKKSKPEYQSFVFQVDSDDSFYCERIVEKMSKSKYNVVNPDSVIKKYGADSLRLYEMFLGPLSQSKPWNMEGIEGVVKFLHKFWALFFDENGQLSLSDLTPEPKVLTILHRTLKKIEDDIARLSLNTCISTFMICVNELQKIKCNNYHILRDLLITLASFAPHITEELWRKLGHVKSIHLTCFPEVNIKYLEKKIIEYVVSINGKKRTTIKLDKGLSAKVVEEKTLALEVVKKWTEGKTFHKVIVVPDRLINFVV